MRVVPQLVESLDLIVAANEPVHVLLVHQYHLGECRSQVPPPRIQILPIESMFYCFRFQAVNLMRHALSMF